MTYVTRIQYQIECLMTLIICSLLSVILFISIWNGISNSSGQADLDFVFRNYEIQLGYHKLVDNPMA